MTGKLARSFACILVLSILVLPVLSGLASPAMSQDREKVTLRFTPEEGRVFKYKGDSRNKVFYGPYSFETVTGQEIEMSLLEPLENGNFRMSVTFTKSSTKMMRMGNLIEQEPRVKPEGRTIKVEVDPKGKVVEALGFIMGVKKGRALDSYMEMWFFELPEEAVGPGSAWEVTIDEKGGEGDEEVYTVKGAGKFKVNKIEKKNGVMVAEIEGEADVEIHSDSQQGVFDGRSRSKQKVYIAIDGGYIVEGSSSAEIKGKMVSQDENGKETENEVTRTESHEIKLEK
jgi:hypothetical protein